MFLFHSPRAHHGPPKKGKGLRAHGTRAVRCFPHAKGGRTPGLSGFQLLSGPQPLYHRNGESTVPISLSRLPKPVFQISFCLFGVHHRTSAPGFGKGSNSCVIYLSFVVCLLLKQTILAHTWRSKFEPEFRTKKPFIIFLLRNL
jgi:hypothetical protein